MLRGDQQAMFCPRCATENGPELSYCRQCGLRLADLRLALEGKAIQSWQRMNRAEKWIKGGSATLLSFMVIALIIAILSVTLGEPSLSLIAMINALLGAAIGLPLVFVGKASLKRARRLLSPVDAEFNYSAMKPGSPNQLPTSPEVELLRPRATSPVTENTTLNLQESAAAPQGPRQKPLS